AMIPPRTPEVATERVVAADDAGRTLAAVVRVAMAVPWRRAKELCTRGCVRVDGVLVRDDTARVATGQRVAIDPRAKAVAAPAHDLSRDRIVFLDADVVVVDKPADLQTVPFDDDDHDSLVQRLAVLLRRIENHRGPPPRVVQRLDKDTTGLVVFARTRTAERELAQQLRAHSMHRRYLGLAFGDVRAATFDTHLVPNAGDHRRGSWRPRGRERTPPANAKRAITHVEPIESFAIDPSRLVSPPATVVRATLVACTLETGRTHQIRIHLAEAGHPLIGEPVYARGIDVPRLVPPTTDAGAVPLRPLLHAAELGFVHPQHGRPLRFERALPPDALAWLDHLRGRTR
ncbi:MAG TPA: RluA family pseudouridine synthase, partial [Nannocystaceae bacterium]|nr:RluA family pseudouridine synthase [Nannocystaceae bacterium]